MSIIVSVRFVLIPPIVISMIIIILRKPSLLSLIGQEFGQPPIHTYVKTHNHKRFKLYLSQDEFIQVKPSSYEYKSFIK